MNNQKGMTLVEVLIALAILGATAVTFLSGLTGSLKGTMIAQEQTIAESLARSQLEAIKNADYNTDKPTPTYQKITIPPEKVTAGYDVIIAVKLLDPENDSATDDDGLQKVTVTVKRGDKSLLTMENYKAFK